MPLQMVTAVSTVANGGELVEPRAIRAVYRDNRRYTVEPKVVRRVVSADAAADGDGGQHRRQRWGACRTTRHPRGVPRQPPLHRRTEGRPACGQRRYRGRW